MTSEEVQNEIKLIFARACAESLKETAGSILAMGDGEREEAAKAHGAAFASAFVFVSARFRSGCSATQAEREHTGQSSSTPEAEPQ